VKTKPKRVKGDGELITCIEGTINYPHLSGGGKGRQKRKVKVRIIVIVMGEIST